jgi:hypothetical protein
MVESCAPDLMGLDVVLTAEFLQLRLYSQLLVSDLTLVHQVGHRGGCNLACSGAQVQLLSLQVKYRYLCKKQCSRYCEILQVQLKYAQNNKSYMVLIAPKKSEKSFTIWQKLQPQNSKKSLGRKICARKIGTGSYLFSFKI